jgi:transposase-like protein
MEQLHLCKHCGRSFSLQDKGVESWWDNNGMSSVKLCSCPECKRINIIKYEIYWEEDINNDKRLFI